jgi:hypothetical protein
MSLRRAKALKRINYGDKWKFRNSFDAVFKVLLLVFCLAMIVLFVYTGFFSESNVSEKVLMSLLSGGGMSGAFILYMKWRIIELVIAKGQQDPNSLNADFLNRALSLIQRTEGEAKDGEKQ